MKDPEKTILVLDAGGTNLVFNVVKDGKLLDQTFSLPARSENLDNFLEKMIHGFRKVNRQTGEQADAISFSFPGPADYENGIIGDLENLSFFRGGVHLKNMLEHKFKVPVFINNDGDLFALGEAIGGLLPETNRQLKENDIQKEYRNLLGITLGTGFGGGIIINGRLLTGDNSAGAEINRILNPENREWSIEETISIRGIRRLYAEETGLAGEKIPGPYTIFQIGKGLAKGPKGKALAAWERFGEVLGEVLANAVTLIDGLVVIGGGLSGAYHFFLPKTIEMMNRAFSNADGSTTPRMEIEAYNLNDSHGRKQFFDRKKKTINVPFSNETASYYPQKKTGVGITRLGTSQAVAMGAYAFAVKRL